MDHACKHFRIRHSSLVGAPNVCLDCGRIEGSLDTDPSVTDAVDHPKHYTSSPAKCSCGKQIECIQITEHMNFNKGNALKYIWRAGEKGDEIEDLLKAKWYIEREIARLRG